MHFNYFKLHATVKYKMWNSFVWNGLFYVTFVNFHSFNYLCDFICVYCTYILAISVMGLHIQMGGGGAPRLQSAIAKP